MDFCTNFLEPEINREASQFVVDNYEALKKDVIIKFRIPQEKSEDLLNDVYISLVETENEGNGFNMNRSNKGDCIMVSQFVYGRIKGYSENIRYRTDVVESGRGGGRAYAASGGDSGDFKELDSLQVSYALARTYDDIEEIEDELSIKENIEYCLQFDNIIGLKMNLLLKNIDILVGNNIHKSLLEKLKNATIIHDEFGEAFKNVIQYAIRNRAKFDSIVSSV